MPALPYLAAALAGALVGWLVCAIVLRRGEHEVPAGRRDEAELAATVLDRVSTGYLVLDENGHQRLANPSTEALGLAHLGLPEPAILELASAARATGEPQAAELPGRRTGVDSVQVLAQDIGDGLVLVVGTDTSAARRAEAVRRDFVANVSHELKTPVTAIGLLAEAVLGGADDAELVRSFGIRMQRESSRLATMVTELIALSAVQGSGQLAAPVPVAVDDVVADAIDRASVAAGTASIALTTDEPSGLMVAGDRGLLATAVTNLVENAVAYSPAGSAVSVSRTTRGDRVEIAVTDRGIGIAAEHQQRVFERFFRVDPARSRATGGTGLGLSIVKHVAAIHGGSVSLWSRVGIGSTFTMSLPRVTLDGAGGVGVDGAGVDGAGAHDEVAGAGPGGTGARAGGAGAVDEVCGADAGGIDRRPDSCGRDAGSPAGSGWDAPTGRGLEQTGVS